MANTLTVVARLTAEPGAAEVLQDELTRLVLESRAQKGCIRYILNRGVDDPDVFVLVEEWRNRELWEAHRSGQPLIDFRERVAEGVVASTEVHPLTAVA